MTRNQVLLIAFCAVLGIGIYLFADTKKPKEKLAEAEHEHTPGEQPAAETLDINAYITETNAGITSAATKKKVEEFTATGNYKELMVQYQQLDKPLAVAHFAVKLAEKENKPESFAAAGDYNALLLQTAPDEKAAGFLRTNLLTCYQKAVDLDSNNTNNRIRLAGAIIEHNPAPMQGVAILLDIVRKDSANTDAQLMLSRFAIVSGQYDKAIVRLEKILHSHPQNSEALLLLAEAYKAKGDNNKAVEMLERCKKTVTDAATKKEIEKYIEQIKKPNG